jgi:hypothetical protein
MEKMLSFSEALEALKLRNKIYRFGWNGKGMHLELQIPDENSKMTRPYIYMVLPKGSTEQFGDAAKEIDRVPWLASQTDLLAIDWLIKD